MKNYYEHFVLAVLSLIVIFLIIYYLIVELFLPVYAKENSSYFKGKINTEKINANIKEEKWKHFILFWITLLIVIIFLISLTYFIQLRKKYVHYSLFMMVVFTVSFSSLVFIYFIVKFKLCKNDWYNKKQIIVYFWKYKYKNINNVVFKEIKILNELGEENLKFNKRIHKNQIKVINKLNKLSKIKDNAYKEFYIFKKYINRNGILLKHLQKKYIKNKLIINKNKELIDELSITIVNNFLTFMK